jgi:hypothetical protein
MSNVIRIVIMVLETGRHMAFDGREAFTANALIEAGDKGVRPIDRPAPRWSHYVMMLRRAGLDIETIREPHGGAFPGNHGHYVLRTKVAVVRKTAANDNAPR